MWRNVVEVSDNWLKFGSFAYRREHTINVWNHCWKFLVVVENSLENLKGIKKGSTHTVGTAVELQAVMSQQDVIPNNNNNSRSKPTTKYMPFSLDATRLKLSLIHLSRVDTNKAQ